MTEVLGIIPARGGSKGLPGKNILPVAGKPLIAWTIDAALNANLINRVIVSTDDSEIAETAQQYNAEVPFIRPSDISDDNAKSIDVMIHAVNSVKHKGYNPDFVMLLQPTSPLRTSVHIDEAVNRLLSADADALVSVKRAETHPYLTVRQNAQGYYERYIEESITVSRRQDMSEAFANNGAIYLIRTDVLLSEKTFYPQKTLIYPMSDKSSIDIDTAEDVKLVEEALGYSHHNRRNSKTNDVMIASKPVGPGHPCFIIAEAGVNHNGDLEMAKELVRKAVEAKADAVKFQTFKSEKLVAASAPKAEYQKECGNAGESQLDMLRRLEFGRNEFIELKAYCRKLGIIFLSTPFDDESLDLLTELELVAYKLPSPEINNTDFIFETASRHKPVILSTGTADIKEVAAAVKAVERAENSDLFLLHCVSAYPARLDDCNLLAMKTMADKFGYPVGFSDHTIGKEAILAAVAMGACIVEKHFTLDKNLPGPDHKASMEPDELKDLVESIRKTEMILGHGVKKPAACEHELAAVARKSIVAATDIAGGTVIEKYMLTKRRPGTGIQPDRLPEIVGRKAAKNIFNGEIISWNMLD